MNNENKILLQKHLDILSFRDLAEGTIASYQGYMNQFITYVEQELPGKSIPDVSWEDIRAYVRYLKDVRQLNNRTINYHIAQLHDLWNYVLKKDWDRYEVPFLHYDEKLPSVPTVDEVRAIIDSIDNPKHKAEIALLYSSGIRVSELVNLRCGDIYSRKKAIFISKAKNRTQRYAVLSDRAFELLKNYVKSMYPNATQSDWLFPGQRSKGQVHIHDQSVRNVFNKACASLGYSEKGFKLHSLRHAFGLHLYEAGTDIISIKEAMGHRSLSSTEVYLTLGIGNGRSVTSPYDM